jgi:hypothetical protein
MTDFMNFKIKLTQYFRCTYRDRLYICIFIKVNSYICINIYIYTIFLTKFFSPVRSVAIRSGSFFSSHGRMVASIEKLRRSRNLQHYFIRVSAGGSASHRVQGGRASDIKLLLDEPLHLKFEKEVG